MPDKSIQDLVKIAQSGDKIAFGRLIERHYAKSLMLANQMISHPEVARELVQDAMLQAYLSLSRLKAHYAFSSWLYSIVLNICKNHIRRQFQTPQIHIESNLLEDMTVQNQLYQKEWQIDPKPNPEDMMVQREIYDRALKAVQNLAPKQRKTTLMFYCDQYSEKEIAEVQGISIGTVKSQLHQARQRLQKARSWIDPDRLPSPSRRRLVMIPVTIAHITSKLDEHACVLYLQENQGKRCLPVIVHSHDGYPLSRPQDFPHYFKQPSLACTIIQTIGVTVEKICIEPLHDRVFYARITLQHNTTQYVKEARPIDAFKLAFETDAPIMVSRDLMQTAGIPISEITEQLDYQKREGYLEIIKSGEQRYGFLRSSPEALPAPFDVYIAPGQVHRFGLKNSDRIETLVRPPKQDERWLAAIKIERVNGITPEPAPE